MCQCGDGYKATPLYCRSWSCDICHPRRTAELKRKAAKGFPTTFITLTVNPAWGEEPEDRAKRLVTAWRMLRQKLKRMGIADKVPFLAVFEKTKRGEPHLHIIARAPFISQKLISQFMREYMAAPVVDIRKVKSRRGVARYISKYVSKASHHFAGCKRYWCSQDWHDLDQSENLTPSQCLGIVRERFDQVKAQIDRLGWYKGETLNGGYLFVSFWHHFHEHR